VVRRLRPLDQEKEDIVSWAERFVRHHHQQTDRAISAAFARLELDPRARAIFVELLGLARRRARRIFEAPVDGARHPGVDALVHLAGAADHHIRRPSAWTGSAASWRPAVHALAGHLVGAYPVPAFLGNAWHTADERSADAQRRWFVGHARGRPFRTLDLPFAMTRRMEHLFLRSPAHVGIPYALRRAELLALGATAEFADAILAARPALDLEHGDFWRTAWQFLIANAAAIDRLQVAPIVDFLHGIRHEPIEVETAAGLERRDPMEPDFSLHGRTVRSVVRLMERWHRGLGRTPGRFDWAPSGLRPLTLEDPPQDPESPPIFWELVELTSTDRLREEGAALRHCVGSYGWLCARGDARIWSLRRRREGRARSVLTIDVDPRRKAILQVRGLRNRAPTGRAWRVVQNWARREQLRLSV
jgi:hypothetical protein